MRTLATLLVATCTHVAHAQTPTPQPPPTTAARPPRPTPPTRAVDGPGAPPFTKVPSGNAPLAPGNFVIGPDYSPAPELTVQDGVPAGRVTQFTLESKHSKFYPGIAREAFGTPDPNNPKTLMEIRGGAPMRELTQRAKTTRRTANAGFALISEPALSRGEHANPPTPPIERRRPPRLRVARGDAGSRR